MTYEYRRSRIGVDLEHEPLWRIYMSYFNACLIGLVVPLDTRKGYHIRIPKEGLTREQNIHLRRLLCDDKIRLWYDDRRLYLGLKDWIDTLFQGKREHGRISGERLNPIVFEPFWVCRGVDKYSR